MAQTYFTPTIAKKNGVLWGDTSSYNGVDPFNLYKVDAAFRPVQFTFEVDTTLDDGLPRFVIPLRQSSMNLRVFWGDGERTYLTVGQGPGSDHTYAVGGTYQIATVGNMSGSWSTLLGSTRDRKKITTVLEWSDNFSPSTFSWYDIDNLVTFDATGGPTYTGVSLQGTFVGAALVNDDLAGWDVSGATNFNSVFRSAPAFNNSSINSWSVSGVSTFEECFEFSNYTGSLSNWDVSGCTNFKRLGDRAGFNGDISNWNVSSGQNFELAFYFNPVFNRDISGWVVGSATNMRGMFQSAGAFDVDISGWDVSSNELFTRMFYADFVGQTIFNKNLTSWDVSSGTDFQSMFQSTNFTGDVSEWKFQTVNPINMRQMFNNCQTFNSDISTKVVNPGLPNQYTAWDTSAVTSMQEMFQASTTFNQNIGTWDVGNVTNMAEMLKGTLVFNQDISGWNIGSLVNASDFLGSNSAFSTTNYDLLLDNTSGWLSVATPQNNVTIVFSPTKYTSGGNAEAGRNLLTGTYGWTITDGGPV
jgi:surface protein